MGCHQTSHTHAGSNCDKDERDSVQMRDRSALASDSVNGTFFARQQILAFPGHGHLLAAFQELSDVQDIADTTVAHRYRDDPKRQQRPPPKRVKRTATPPQRPAAGGGPASHTSRYSVIHISDSEELEELLNGGASSTD